MDFAEFFAGAGLVREGLASDGWNCAWANDICPDKEKAYSLNFGLEDFLLSDVWEVARQPDQLPDNLFLYTASFPCTDLSVAGGRAGLEGVESGALNAVLSIIAAKQRRGGGPRVVMLENVQGFLTSNKGKDIANTVDFFTNHGYYTDIIQLNASWFTPQSRPRVFLFAVEETIAERCMSIVGDNERNNGRFFLGHQISELRPHQIQKIIKANNNFKWGMLDIPAPAERDSTLADIVELEVANESSLWWDEKRKDHLHNQMSERHREVLHQMTTNDYISYGTVYKRMRKKRPMAELRVDGIAGCLRTPRGGSSKQILVRAGHGAWDVRFLTPREYARLQGVRDEFVLPEKSTKGYFAMGDAVCVPVIEYLSRHVLLPLHQNFIGGE